MRRRVVTCSLAALLQLFVAAGAAPPATAVPSDVCAGTVQINLSQGVLVPLLPWMTTTTTGATTTNTTTFEGATTAGFSFNTVTGVCATSSSLAGAGTVTGYCGHAGGQGVTVDGYSFGFVVVGALLVVTGELTGVAVVTADPTAPNNSCFQPGSALTFIAVGNVAKCTPQLVTSLTTLLTPVPFTPLTNLTTAGPPFSNHTTVHAQSVHVSVHACI